MKLVTKFHLFFALMLTLSLGGTALSVWSIRQANFQVERLNLAHDVYETYLALESHTYQLFKQFGDALIIGDRDRGAGEKELIAKIRGDISKIRHDIGTEIKLVGDEEIEELVTLSQIEFTIEKLITALRRISREQSDSAFATNWEELSRILDADIDRDFRTLIESALAEEAKEVAETRETAQGQLVLYQSLAAFFALTALLAALASLRALRTQFGRPVERLLAGVQLFSEGNFEHRIGLKGRDELAAISGTFDLMASRVADKTKSLASQNAELEKAVGERTEQLERLLQDANRSDANRRRMLADVSHELRTPLTIIQGEAEIALRGTDKTSDTYREALNRTRDAATHTARIVDDLLFVARTESGEVRLSLEDFDLRALIQEIGRNFGPSATLLTDLNAAPMRGDAGRIRQAMLILLDNARHYGGTNINLRLDQTPNGYRAAVEDDGPGMSEADKESAFQRFFRGSNAAERYRDGSGLGLPVALSIAEAHGGSINLSDRHEGGLVASMTLPRRTTLRVVTRSAS